MSNHPNSNDDAQLDQLLVQANNAQQHTSISDEDALLKARIMAALPMTSAPPTTTGPNAWLDTAWQWFTQPLRLTAAAALPLLVGFALGNATLITDNELLIALSEQDSWPLEQMLDETQWSEVNE